MANMKWNRPKRYNPLFSEEKKEIARGTKILKDRVERGHANPQAHLHGPVKIYNDEEKAVFVADNPDRLKLPPKPSGKSRGTRK